MRTIRQTGAVLSLFLLIVVFPHLAKSEPADLLKFYMDGQLIEAPLIKDQIVIERNQEVASDRGVSFNYKLQHHGISPLPQLRMEGNTAVYHINEMDKLPSRVEVPEELKDEVRSFGPIYKLPGGFTGTLTGQIIVGLKSNTTQEDFNQLLDKHDLAIDQQLSVAEKVYLLKPSTEDAGIDAISSHLYETGLFELARPRILIAPRFEDGRPAPMQPASGLDRSSAESWHLQRITVADAWRMGNGEGRTIAIIDKPIDGANPALRNNLICENGGCTAPPSSSDSLAHHGTAVAGLAAAADIGRGVIGVCPRCQVLPILALRADPWDQGQLIRDAVDRGADIINISALFRVEKSFRSAAEYAARARDGLGVPIVVAIGNDASSEQCEWGLASIESVIAVGASTAVDTAAEYSNSGPCLDLLAPGGDDQQALWTTDLVGEPGRNASSPDPTCREASRTNKDYTSCFAGTSAAAPLVSGTIALMLAQQPQLSADEVWTILRETADKIAPNLAAYNGAGFSQRYGYGRLNSAAALAHVNQFSGHQVSSVSQLTAQE